MTRWCSIFVSKNAALIASRNGDPRLEVQADCKSNGRGSLIILSPSALPAHSKDWLVLHPNITDMSQNKSDNLQHHPLALFYRKTGVPDELLGLGLKTLEDALEGLPLTIKPQDDLGKYLENHLVDSDFDWFWLTTSVELGKVFGIKPETVEEEMSGLATSSIDTVDDYFQLLIRYFRLKGM